MRSKYSEKDLLYIINSLTKKIKKAITFDYSVFATNFCENSKINYLQADTNKTAKSNYISDSLIGKSFTESDPILVEDIENNPLYNSSSDNPFQYNIKSIILIPCFFGRRKGDLFGTLLLYREHEKFNDDELKNANSITKKFIADNFNKIEPIASYLKECIDNKITSDLQSAFDVSQLREFFSSVVHDIRTPMNAIIGFLELIKEDANDTEKEYANAALKSAEMVISLVNDVLDFNKIISGNLDIDFHYFSLPEELESTSKVFYHTARKKKIDLISYFDPEIPYAIKSDPFRVKQIINNLLSNAIKFTDVEGEVDLEAFYNKENDTLIVNVRDNGIGISEKSIHTIFEPFKQADSTTSSKYGGTGLGLSIAKKLANMLGGDLTVRSKLGEGSTFTLTIPCHTIPGSPKYLEYSSSDFPMIYLIEGDESKHRYINHYSRYFERLDIPYEIIQHYEISEKNIDPKAILIGVKFNYESQATQDFIDSYIDQLIMIQHRMFIRLRDKHKNLFLLEAPVFPEKLFEALLNFEEKKKKTPLEEKQTSNKKILVVDDNAINRKLMEELATRLGSEVFTASDGQEAIEAFAKEPVDLIFIDQNMPVLSGTEAIKKIRSLPKGENVEIYGLTGTADDATIKTMIDAGANAILSKPVQISKLKEIILN